MPPSPNSNANPKPNPDPERGSIFLGGNFPDIEIKDQNKIYGTSFADNERFNFYLQKNHVFIEEDNPSIKVVTIDEELDAVKVDGIGNLVK